MTGETETAAAPHIGQKVGLWLAPLLGIVLLLLPAPEGLTPAAWRVVAIAIWMGLWWATEAVPIAAAALLPIVAFPLLGVTTLKAATTPYAEPIIFLLLGGFLIAASLERWGLHRRIALAVLARVGTSPARLVLGFMIATAFLSMWISNSATTMMMAPIALSVAAVMGGDEADNQRFAACLLLGICYAASIGGVGTLIGTPPNVLAAGYLRQTFGLELSFIDWMKVGVPIVLVLTPLTWWLMVRRAIPVRVSGEAGSATFIAAERARLGPVSRPEWRTALCCIAIALAWMFRPLLADLPGLGALSDEGLAVGMAMLMFVIPAGSVSTPQARLLDWSAAKSVNWGVILLFGGGLSLAAAMDQSGLAQALGEALAGLGAWPVIALVLLLCAVATYLSEIMSNTALVAALLPVLGAGAKASGIDPHLLIVPTAIAASCGFMLPAATGPNAIVFGTGRIEMRQFIRAGFIVDIAAILVVAAVCSLLVPVVFG